MLFRSRLIVVISSVVKVRSLTGFRIRPPGIGSQENYTSLSRRENHLVVVDLKDTMSASFFEDLLSFSSCLSALEPLMGRVGG